MPTCMIDPDQLTAAGEAIISLFNWSFAFAFLLGLVLADRFFFHRLLRGFVRFYRMAKQ